MNTRRSYSSWLFGSASALVVLACLGGPTTATADSLDTRTAELIEPPLSVMTPPGGTSEAVDGLQTMLREFEHRIRQLGETRQSVVGERDDLRERLAVAETRLARSEFDLRGARSALGESEEVREALSGEMVALRDERQGQLDDLGAQLADATARNAGLMVELETNTRRLEAQAAEIQEVRTRVGLLNSVLAEFGTDAPIQAEPVALGPSRITTAADVDAALASLGADTIRHGLLITVSGDKLFSFDSRDIEQSAFGTLKQVADVMRFFDDRDVLIVGHTDSVGDIAYNQMLSEQRAVAVKDYFVDQFGIGSPRIRTAGASDSRPIASNNTPLGRSLNRRVEVVIQDTDAPAQFVDAGQPVNGTLISSETAVQR